MARIFDRCVRALKKSPRITLPFCGGQEAVMSGPEAAAATRWPWAIGPTAAKIPMVAPVTDERGLHEGAIDLKTDNAAEVAITTHAS
jgi:hypothetical protein